MQTFAPGTLLALLGAETDNIHVKILDCAIVISNSAPGGDRLYSITTILKSGRLLSYYTQTVSKLYCPVE